MFLIIGISSKGVSYEIYKSIYDFGRVAVCIYIATLCICIATGSLALPATLSGWGLCILFSLLVTTCALVLFQRSIFLIGGPGASILSTLEPITSVIIGIVVFGEPFGIPVLAGTVLVIAASIITVFFKLRKEEP